MSSRAPNRCLAKHSRSLSEFGRRYSMKPITFVDKGAPLQILCLGAHSDDIEIGCGGTLLRLLTERPGSGVDWVVFSANADREREARASASEFLTAAARSNVVVKGFRESYFP